MRRLPVAPLVLACALLAGLGSGCGSVASAAAELRVGETRPVGEGSIRSWVALAGDGAPAAVGVTLTEGALSGFLPERDTAITLRLPPEAAATVFDHVELSWIAGGDAPEDVFAHPRFDAHFYLVTPQEREAIGDAGRAAQIPALELIPPSYVPVAELIPRVGAHWIDPTAPEFHGEAFTASLLYGFYGGRMVFVEPRIARAFLETRPDVTRELKLPRRSPRPGYYPTRYRVRYDAATQEYTVALEGLVHRP